MGHMGRPAVLLPSLLLVVSSLLSAQGAPAQSSCTPTPAGDLPGSVLVYNLYASDVVDPGATNSLITVMNVGTAKSLVRLMLVGAGCTVISDQLLSLQPNQARSFPASTLAPGQLGYAIAIEVDGNGLPSGRNGILGSVSVKSASPFGSFGAEAIAFVGAPGGAPFRLDGATIALDFDGVSYAALPLQLELDHFVAARDDATFLAVNAPGGVLPSSPRLLGELDFVVWNENEDQFTDSGAGQSFECQLRNSLRSLAPPDNTSFGALRTPGGRMRIEDVQTALAGGPPGPILGAVLTPLGGHNLRNAGALSATLSFPRTVPCPRAPVAPSAAPSQADLCGASEGHKGSVLFFSTILGGDAGSTEFSITNAGSAGVRVRAFWLSATDDAGCVLTKVDFELDLTPDQPLLFNFGAGPITGTASIPVPAADRSMLVVFAITSDGTCAQVSYNHLAGTAFVSDAATGHAAALPAVAVRAVTAAEGDVVGNPGRLVFDGAEYEKLPARLVVDRVGSALDGNDTQLIVNRVGRLDLRQDCIPAGPGTLRGTLFDAVGKGKGFQAAAPTLQVRAAPRDFFPGTFDRIVPAGQGGAMELRVTDGAGAPEAILGVVLEHNPTFDADPAAFRRGHNLHIVARAASAELLYDSCAGIPE